MSDNDERRARVIGAAVGGLIGFLAGAGTGIAGKFGAFPGVWLFTPIGIVWGLSAGPDLVRILKRGRSN